MPSHILSPMLHGPVRWARQLGWPASCVLVAMLAPACATYRAQPLGLDELNPLLAPMDQQVIRIKATTIQHPILRPIDFDLADGLSADEAAILAVIANPKLRSERDKRDVAQAQLLQAGLLPNPQLTGSFDQPVGGSTAGTVTGWGVGLDYDISALITHGAEVDAARAEAASIDLDIAWSEWQAAEDAKLHVVRLTWLQRQNDEAAAAQSRAEQSTAKIREAVSHGLLTQTELDASETERQRIKLLVLETQSTMQTERLALNQSIGLPAETVIRIQASPPVQNPARLSSEQIASELEERRLDLIALRLGYQSQEAKLRAAVLSQFPKVSIGFNGASDTSNVITAGLGISVDLPLFDRAQGKIAIETATRQQLFDEYVARSFEARSNVAALYSEMESLAERIDAMDEYIVRLESLESTYARAVQNGAVDILVYYQVQNTLTDTKLDAMKLRQDQAELVIGLELARGQVFPSAMP